MKEPGVMCMSTMRHPILYLCPGGGLPVPKSWHSQKQRNTTLYQRATNHAFDQRAIHTDQGEGRNRHVCYGAERERETLITGAVDLLK